MSGARPVNAASLVSISVSLLALSGCPTPQLKRLSTESTEGGAPVPTQVRRVDGTMGMAMRPLPKSAQLSQAAMLPRDCASVLKPDAAAPPAPQLSRDEIICTMRALQPKLDACAPPGERLSLTVRLRIFGSGKVGNVEAGGPHAEHPASACVVREIAAMQFRALDSNGANGANGGNGGIDIFYPVVIPEAALSVPSAGGESAP